MWLSIVSVIQLSLQLKGKRFIGEEGPVWYHWLLWWESLQASRSLMDINCVLQLCRFISITPYMRCFFCNHWHFHLILEAFRGSCNPARPSSGPHVLTMLPLSWWGPQELFFQVWSVALCRYNIELYPLHVETLSHLCKSGALAHPKCEKSTGLNVEGPTNHQPLLSISKESPATAGGVKTGIFLFAVFMW